MSRDLSVQTVVAAIKKAGLPYSTYSGWSHSAGVSASSDYGDSKAVKLQIIDKFGGDCLSRMKGAQYQLSLMNQLVEIGEASTKFDVAFRKSSYYLGVEPVAVTLDYPHRDRLIGVDEMRRIVGGYIREMGGRPAQENREALEKELAQLESRAKQIKALLAAGGGDKKDGEE